MKKYSGYFIIFIFILFGALLANVVFNIRSTIFVGVTVGVSFFIILTIIEWKKTQNEFGGKMAKQFKKMGNLHGKPLHEIVSEVGPYASHQDVVITDNNNAPGHFYTWRTEFYFIQLLFDQYNRCLGVNQEKLLKRK